MNPLLQIYDNTTDKYVTIKVSTYEMDYAKIWGSSVTNMVGSTRSTLIGIQPVIKASTLTLYQNGANKVATLLSQGYMMVKFYDSGSATIQEEQYTSSDPSIVMIRENGKWYEEVSFTLTPVDIQGVIS